VRLITGFVVLANLSLAHAGVLTVGGPGAAYSDLQSAVNAAVDGDVLRVRGSTSAIATVDGKGISIIADDPTHLSFGGGLIIRNVPSGSTALVAGFALSWFGSPAVRIENCAGAVRLQDLVTTATSSGLNGPQPVVTCSNAADIGITRCTFLAQSGLAGFSGVEALHAQSSTIAIYDSTLAGGNGGNGQFGTGPLPTNGFVGGAAVVALNSVVFASGSTFQGGTGGNGVDGGVPAPQCTTPTNYPTAGGAGGPCVRLLGSSGDGFANNLIGGAGGVAGVSPCGQGGGTANPGGVEDPTGAAWNEVAGIARTMSLPNLVRESTTFTITFHGAPGDRVFLTSSLAPAHDASALLGGVFLVHGPYRRISPGLLDASGTLTITLPASALPIGIEEDARHDQCVMLSANGQLHLGSSGVLTRLDSAF
jgi:hypothetical protein